MDVNRDQDDRVWALAADRLTDPVSRRPALSAGSTLLRSLTPVPGTSLTIAPPDHVVFRLKEPSIAVGQALVLPIAYDAAWRVSSGEIRNIAGLLAVVGVDEDEVAVAFVPDAIARLQAFAMTLAQILAVVGLLGLACVGQVKSEDASDFGAKWGRMVSRVTSALQPLRQSSNWPYLGYTLAILLRPDWQTGESHTPGILTGLLLPMTALIVARLTQREQWHRWGGGATLALALANVAARGSQAASASHDPLFWGMIAVVALGMSAVARRWQGATWAATAIAGACTVIATLLPAFPDFESRLPNVDLDVARQSFGVIADQFGVLATAFLFAWWGHAIAGVDAARGELVRRPAGRW